MQSLPNVLDNEAMMGLAENAEFGGSRVSSERTDRQLVDLFVAGDSTAFEQLFDRHKRYVARLAGKYLNRHEDVEEIVQITFAKAFVEMPKFRGDHQFSMMGWLRRITVNACIDQLRKQKRKPEDLCCELSDGEVSTLERFACSGGANGAAKLSDRDLVEKLLGHLDPEDRAVMQMLYAEDMSVAEIGELLGWSGSKVKIRAWRARRTLRKVLGKYL